MNIYSLRLSILLILSTVYFGQAHVVDQMALCREPLQQLVLTLQDTISHSEAHVIFPLHVMCGAIPDDAKAYIPIVYVPKLPSDQHIAKAVLKRTMLIINEEQLEETEYHLFKLSEQLQNEYNVVCMVITGKDVGLIDAYLNNPEQKVSADVLQQMSMDELLDDLHEHGIFDNHDGPKDMNAVQGFFVQAAAYVFLGCLKLKTSIVNILSGDKEKA